ncbi:MAG TPA: hypothetical protein VGF29_16375 [Hyphomicrobiaceae bacterium]|jgi:hypothetical protein
MTKEPDMKASQGPVDPRAFADFLRRLERRIEELWATNPAREPEPPPDPWAALKPGALIAAEKEVRCAELVEKLELALCGGPEACKQAKCRRTRRCAKLARLRLQTELARSMLAREHAKWKPPSDLPPPQGRRKPRA